LTRTARQRNSSVPWCKGQGRVHDDAEVERDQTSQRDVGCESPRQKRTFLPLNGRGGIRTAVSSVGMRTTILNPHGPTAQKILRAIKYGTNT
jgi:hypothetical protein